MHSALRPRARGNCVTDTLETYRVVIQSLLADYEAIPISNGEIECYTFLDTHQDHYQGMNVGWKVCL
ncbi:MAG: element excision factor XisI family protein [Cyanobacteria bacterium P01_D01_bin.56]